MIVTKSPNKTLKVDPQAGTLWVDDSGVVYLLHTGKEETYQLTRLDNGALKAISTNKVDLVQSLNVRPCPYPVVIRNEGVDHGGN